MTKLAVDGGRPVREKQWPKWPFIAEDEIEEVATVLRSGKINYWTGSYEKYGEEYLRGKCGVFEKKFSEYLGVKHSIAVSNGTTALELCLKALNLSAGDEVLVPSRTFIATASACVTQNLVPVFCDIEKDTQNISVESIQSNITEKTKAIICVHLAGIACDMDSISKIAKDNNLYIIEDCAQSLGGKYNDQMLGTFGDINAFSFCQDKIMTTGGEGGMVVTNNDNLYLKAWEYKDHGKNFHVFNKRTEHVLVDSEQENQGFYSSIGTNLRMTEMQAAIGIKQLEKMPSWTERRRSNIQKLKDGLKNIKNIYFYDETEKTYHAGYKFYVYLKLENLKPEWCKRTIVTAINNEGVSVELGSTWAIGNESGWSKLKTISSRNSSMVFENDKFVGDASFALQVHPTLGDGDMEDLITSIEKVMNFASVD